MGAGVFGGGVANGLPYSQLKRLRLRFGAFNFRSGRLYFGLGRLYLRWLQLYFDFGKLTLDRGGSIRGLGGGRGSPISD